MGAVREDGDPLAQRDAAAAREAWFGEVAASLNGLEVYAMAIVAIDARSGKVLAATTKANEIAGGSLPARLGDLVEDGTIARPDLHRLARHLGQLPTSSGVGPKGRDSSDGWTDRLRIYRQGAEPRDLRLEVIVHRRTGIDAAVAIATVWPEDEPAGPAPVPAGDLDDLWAVYDADYVMVASDPGFADLSIEPQSQLGTLAWMYVHPDDVPAVQPLVAAVLAGHLRTVRYSARLRARGGRWLPANVEVRRLDTAGGPQLLVVARYIDEARRVIPPGLLSAREVVVVEGLFDGLRVSQIAEQDGVAVKTIRNQLAAIYRKLAVAGQLELLGSYHRPARPDPQAAKPGR